MSTQGKIILFYLEIIDCLFLDEATRSLSGLILKNNIRLLWDAYPADVRQYVRQECLLAIGDSSALIRATVGIIVTNIVSKEGLHQWPSLIPTMCNMVDSKDFNVCEVRLIVFLKSFGIRLIEFYF
jgi:hypothetical protein